MDQPPDEAPANAPADRAEDLVIENVGDHRKWSTTSRKDKEMYDEAGQSSAEILTLPPQLTSLLDVPPVDVAPLGFTPLGDVEAIAAPDAKAFAAPSGIDPGDIPQTANQLEELISHTYDLSFTRAGKLNIPVVGSVSGGYNRRVVIYEWTRFKALHDANGVEYRYGYVVRFCLTVSKWDAKTQINLPFLSAQAQLGNIQASWRMQIRGLVGPQIDAAVLPPQELKVETFVIAKQSLEAVITAINDPTTQFVPGVLLATIDPTSADVEYWLSAVRAYATYTLALHCDA